jgi:tetratricopeptide (TPR) repeat protein
MSVNEFDYQTLLEKTENEDLEELAVVYHQLGCLSNNLNRAISFYKKSIEINLYYRPTDYDLLSATYSNMSGLLNKRGESNEALKYYHRALNIDLRDEQTNQLKIANRYNDIGNVLKDQKKYKEANEYYHHALNIQIKNISLNDPILIITYHNLGSIYRLMNKYPLAFDYYEKALEILEAYLPLQHSLLIYTYNQIGSIYCLMKNYTAAFSCQNKALEMQLKIVHDDHPSLAIRLFNMAIALEGLKKFKEAIDHVIQAIQILRKTSGRHQRKIKHYQQYLDKLREIYNH